MTFDPNVPNAAQSPGIFPAQNNANFLRLKTIINSDHVFNDSPQATDGVHRQMTMVNRSIPGSLPAGTNAIEYTRGFGAFTRPFFYDGTRELAYAQPLSFGCFNQAGVVQGTAFNIASLTVSSLEYTINFSFPLPSTNCQILLSAIEPSSNLVVGKVISFTVNSLVIKFVNQNNTKVNPLSLGTWMIFGGV